MAVKACFRCDGTGQYCQRCGEAERACICKEGADIAACPDCGGSGE